jgi:uncharacterized protein (TIGR02145 family)
MKSGRKYFILLFLLLLIFSPFSCKKDLLKLVSVTPGTYTDTRDGRIYKTTTIGDYTWLAENLDFKTDSSSCYYDNDSVTNKDYGRLYTWQAALAAVPPGWHLPTSAELKYLYDNLGGETASHQMWNNGYSHLAILPGGYYVASSNQFSEKDHEAKFWYEQQHFWILGAYYYSGSDFTYGYSNPPYDKLSVRCVKDY